MKVVVLAQSRTGYTRRAAEYIGGEVAGYGHEVSVHPVTEPDYDALSAADLLFVGTWVGGVVITGHHPGDGAALRTLPGLWDKPCGAFVTYAFHAGGVMKKYRSFLTERLGLQVVADELFRRDLLPLGVDAFVDRTLAAVEAPQSA